MNRIRIAVGELFGAPVQGMNFIAYLQYVNTAGKITARSEMELMMVCLTYIEELEKKVEAYEVNFKEIEEILAKLVNEKKAPIINATAPESPQDQSQPQTQEMLTCEVCGKEVKTKLALSGHMRSHK